MFYYNNFFFPFPSTQTPRQRLQYIIMWCIEVYIYTRIFMIRSYLRGVYPNCRRRRMSRLQRQRRYKVGKKQT